MRRAILGLLAIVVLAAGAGWLWWQRREAEPAMRHLRAGNALARGGDLLGAGHEWQITAALDPTLAEPHESLGRLYLADHAYALAIREFQTAARLQPRRPHAYCQFAEAMMRGGILAQAEEAARYAVRTEPDCPRGHRVLGVLVAARGDYPGGIRETTRAAQLSPPDASLRLALAQMYQDTNQLPAAEAAAREARRLQPDDSRSAALLGQVLIEEADPDHRDEAESLLKEALAADGQNPELHAQLGRLYNARLRLTDARRELERAVRLSPRHLLALTLLAEVYDGLGDLRRGQSTRARAVEYASQDARRAELERRLAANPDHGPSLVQLGDLYARAGDYPHAVDALEHAAVVFNGDPLVLRRLAEVRAQMARAGRSGEKQPS